MATPGASAEGHLVQPRPEVGLLPGYHSPQVAVEVRLNTNESPEPPPRRFTEALALAVGDLDLHRYPDREAVALRTAIAAHHGVEPEQVFCGNGSNEVLQCLLLAYGGRGRSAVVFEPTYALHAHIARLTETEVVSGTRDEAFRIDPASAEATIASAASLAAIVFVCSPNNPTGGAEAPETVAALSRLAPGLVVVDEAYGQFSPVSALELARTERNVAVVRTFSKTWALAALRLGYVVADPEVIEALSRVALPYHLDALKQAAGRLALEFEPEMQARTARLVEQRSRLVAALGDRDVDLWPSDANFVMFRPRHLAATTLWQRLIERSVLIRDLSSWPGLDGCLRVTVGTADEDTRFLAALDAALAEGEIARA